MSKNKKPGKKTIILNLIRIYFHLNKEVTYAFSKTDTNIHRNRTAYENALKK